MTDNTQPEAMDLADWLEAVGGGPSAKRCAALLREQHARIAELEAEIAGGMQALSAAPANHNASRALQGLDFIMRVYEPCMGKPAPDEEMATIVEATKRLLLGWWGEHRDTVRAMLAASPTPPVEQQAQPGAVGRTGCTAGTDEECTRRGCATSCPAQQAAPKAAPVVWLSSKQLRGITALHGQYLPFRQQPEGRFDTPVYLEESAPKAAPGEQNTVPAEWLEQAYREGWAACRDAETIGEEAEDWAFGNSTANSRMIDAQQAAPQQEAQEPVARYTIEDIRKARSEGYRNGVESSVPSKITKEMRHAFREKYKESSIWSDRLDIALEGMLAVAPQPSPAPLSEMPYERRKAIQEGEQIGASDAWFKARHEMLDTLDRRNVFRAGFDRGWSAALAAQGGKDAE